MKKFLIQTIKGEVVHDFSFALLEAIRFDKWKSDPVGYSYGTVDVENIDGLTIQVMNALDFIPVGSVEFVVEFLKIYYNKTPRPINIPKELMDQQWSGREVKNISTTESWPITTQDGVFVKSNDKIKADTKIVRPGELVDPGNYQVSSLIDIESEWRAFVYKGELLGLQNYSGEFSVFPNVRFIKRCISAYKNCPIVYTLDMGILDNGANAVIEVHDFFSCGLYGFSDHQKLPLMFIRWFQNYIK